MSAIIPQDMTVPWKLTPRSKATSRNIQAAILQSAGPVTTFTTTKYNNRFLHNSNFHVTHFSEAAKALQSLGLGDVAAIGKCEVFIKKLPIDAAAILNMNIDLCHPQYYEERYNQPLSRLVSLDLRHRLAAAKLVPKQLLI